MLQVFYQHNLNPGKTQVVDAKPIESLSPLTCLFA